MAGSGSITNISQSRPGLTLFPQFFLPLSLHLCTFYIQHHGRIKSKLEGTQRAQTSAKIAKFTVPHVSMLTPVPNQHPSVSAPPGGVTHEAQIPKSNHQSSCRIKNETSWTSISIFSAIIFRKILYDLWETFTFGHRNLCSFKLGQETPLIKISI